MTDKELKEFEEQLRKERPEFTITEKGRVDLLESNVKVLNFVVVLLGLSWIVHVALT